MSTFYTVRFSNTSRNGVHGLSIKTASMSDNEIIAAASAECARQGISFEELAGIEMIEDAEGQFTAARQMSAEEMLAIAVEKLSDDGRMFEITPENV